MGRNSVDATNAFLILAVRADRSALVPRLFDLLRLAPGLPAVLAWLTPAFAVPVLPAPVLPAAVFPLDAVPALCVPAFLDLAADVVAEGAAGSPGACPATGPAEITTASRPARHRDACRAGFRESFTLMLPL